MITVTGHISIAEREIEESFVRASGPGGQNVNKVATAAQLRFDLAGTRSLSSPVKARLRAMAGSRLNADGTVLIIARNHRTQEGNRREALSRLEELIARASVVPKKRHATRPTLGSGQRRLDHKRERKQVKRLRGRVADD